MSFSTFQNIANNISDSYKIFSLFPTKSKMHVGKRLSFYIDIKFNYESEDISSVVFQESMVYRMLANMEEIKINPRHFSPAKTIAFEALVRTLATLKELTGKVLAKERELQVTLKKLLSTFVHRG